MVKKYPELIVIAVLTAIAIIHVTYFELSQTDVNLAPHLPDGKLTMAQSKSIDTTLDVSHLMLGWS